jgi:hypothetical protein
MSTVEVDSGKGAPPKDPTDPHRGGHGGGHGDGSDELPHLPPPSIRPLIMGIGITVAAFGLVYLTTPPLGLIIVLVGLLIFGIGLGGWIYDDVRAAREGQGGHH